MESRLRVNLDLVGSPEYEMTSNLLDMQSGPPIYQLRASLRRTRGNDYFGRPTVQKQATRMGGLREDCEKGHKSNLEEVVHLCVSGWPTVVKTNFMMPSADRLENLKDGETTRNIASGGEPQNLHERVLLHLGVDLSGLSAQTVSSGGYPVLNKEFCRWLQGFPERWSRLAPTETR